MGQGFAFQTPFDARQVEPTSYAPVPPLADYHVVIVDSEPKQNNAGTGGYLEFTLQILDAGPYQNLKVPHRLNLFHPTQATVEMAYRSLSAICHCVGVFNLQDARQLHNIPFMAKIGPQKDNPQYANVFAVMDQRGNVNGQAPAGAAAPVAAAAPPAAAPWAPPAAPPAAAAPPAWPPAAPAAAPAAPTPPWAPPGQPTAPTAPAPPVWVAPGAPAAPPAAAPGWSPNAQPAAPPWART